MSKENNQEILNKVRALLNKTIENGATESEMESALKLAQKLMAKHNIDQSEINVSTLDINVESVSKDWVYGERQGWNWLLLIAIASGFNCKVIKANKFENEKSFKLVDFYEIVGFYDDRKMVKDLFEITVPVIRNLYKKRYKEYVSNFGKQNNFESLDTKLAKLLFDQPTDKPISFKRFLTSYIDGFVSGLKERLQQDRKEIFQISEEAMEYELMVVKKDALIDEVVEDLTKGKTKNANGPKRDINFEALLIGKEDGKQNNNKKQIH